MRRRDLRNRVARFLAVAMVATTLLGMARAADPYDDRPPLLASVTAPDGAAAATRLLGVEVSDTEWGGKEIRLAADGVLPYQVFTLSGPDRIVFDLPGVTNRASRKRFEVGDALVRVRLGQYRVDPEPMARVVLDLATPLGWHAEQRPDGLAILVGPRDRLEAALRETETAQPTMTATAAPENAPTEAAPASVASAVPSEAPAAAAEEAVESSTEGTTPAPAMEEAVVAPVAEPEVEPVAAEPAAPVPPVARPRPAEAALHGSATGTAAPAPELPPAVERVVQQVEQARAQEPAPITEAPVTRLAADRPAAAVVPLPDTKTKTIDDTTRKYRGQRISLNLVDADIKQVFGVFHDISGLNFVLDPAVSGAVTIVVDNVPWDQALDLILKSNGLDMVLEGNVVRIAPVSKLAQEAAARKALNEARELEDPPVTITRTLSYAKAKEIERVIRDAILSPKGRVIVDERTNTLIIRDVPQRIRAVDKLLTTLDAETPQVMIEARIVEVSRDFVHDLGIRWGMSAVADPSLGTQTGMQFPHRARMDYDLNLPGKFAGANALGFSFGNVLDSFTLDLTLDALETEGYARRLSSPKIATQNNETAEIEQGVRIPIVTTTATEIDVQFVSMSLVLRCTPQITAEGTVILDVEVENNSPDFVNTVGDIPAINTQQAKTKLMVNDGATTVIGGIFSVNEGRSEMGVPWLRHLPVVGWMFRSRNRTQTNRELLIFITPRIIKAS